MLPAPIEGLAQPAEGALLDRYGRAHTYVRVSVTDRCNYRCTYCMPAEGLDWLPKAHLLSFEEIERIVRVLARCGVERVRLTGGEPTVRRDLERLVGMLAAIPGIRDLSMTTNGHLFAPKARAFAEAGLKRVNISLDTLDGPQFARMTRGGDLQRVLAAIDASREAGLLPLKINAVVVGGENEDQVEALVRYFAPHAADTVLRFIEYMPFDGNPRVGVAVPSTGGLPAGSPEHPSNALSPIGVGPEGPPREPARHHVPAGVLRERLEASHGLDPMADDLGGGPAAYWRVRDSGLVVGFISPMTEHFCQACNRLRLQADGHLRTCLSREAAPSLRDLLRAGMSDEALEADLRDRLWAKVAGHEAHLDDFRAFEGVMTGIGG